MKATLDQRITTLQAYRTDLAFALALSEPGVTNRRRIALDLRFVDGVILRLEQRRVSCAWTDLRRQAASAREQRRVARAIAADRAATDRASREVARLAQPIPVPAGRPLRTPMPRRPRVEVEFETVWSPGRDAPPLLGDRQTRAPA